MPQLVLPSVRLHASWLAALDEWGPGFHEDGFGPHVEHDVQSVEGFDRWVRHLHQWADPLDPTVPSATGRVHATHWWITEDDTVLGGIALRHDLDASMLRDGGHIGYGVRPSARGRGLATWALAQVLPIAHGLGLRRVLLTCDDTNYASARVIERNGGVLQDVRETDHGPIRRYWIALPVPARFPAMSGTTSTGSR